MAVDASQPRDKADLLARVEHEWTRLLNLIAPLTERQMAECSPGEWAIKDHLAHIAAWEEFLIANQFRAQSAPDALRVPPAVIDRADENEMNAILWERHCRWSADQVLTFVRKTHAVLLATVDSVGEDDLQTRTLLIGPQMEPKMTWVIWNTYEHYAEHRRTIEAKVHP